MYQDLIGKRFGRLTVTSFSHKDKKHVYWNCLCDCGGDRISSSGNLIHGGNKSCGCLIYNKVRRVQYDEDFFTDIDTREKAYLLGLFVADGSLGVYRQSGVLSEFYFVSKDKELVELFKTHLRFDGTIGQRKDSVAFYIAIHSKKIGLDLSLLGIDNNKSRTAVYPRLTKSLDSHFVRGVLDGDGWVSSHAGYLGRRDPSAGICGTEALITSINSRLPRPCYMGVSVGCWRLICSHKKARENLEWMYQNSEGLRLDRKYKNFLLWR